MNESVSSWGEFAHNLKYDLRVLAGEVISEHGPYFGGCKIHVPLIRNRITDWTESLGKLAPILNSADQLLHEQCQQLISKLQNDVLGPISADIVSETVAEQLIKEIIPKLLLLLDEAEQFATLAGRASDG